MNNIILSTRNIDELIDDIANEVAKRIELWHGISVPQELKPKKVTGVRRLSIEVNIPEAVLRKHIKEIPKAKIGKWFVFDVAEVEAWINSRKQKTSLDVEKEAQNHIRKQTKK